MAALYQKYRPQFFSEVVGQEPIKKILTQEIKKQKIAHSFLFVGPRGIGKTTLARILAKSLNCEKRKEGEFEPCNQCASCKSINAGSDLDIIEIDAASHTGVDNVRENIISVSRTAPVLNKYKVFIIDEAHMLSISAFNALLKTLEEPPKNVIFILATTEAQKVPQTIISRCQRLDFKKISFDDTVKCLKKICAKEKIKVDIDILKNIAYLSEGCLRDAESLLGQILVLDDKRITKEQVEAIMPTTNISLIFSLMELLVKGDRKESIRLINKALGQGIDLQMLSQSFIELLRKILLYKIDPSLEEFSQEFDNENKRKINSFSQSLEEEQICSIIEIFKKRLLEIEFAKIIQLPLEMAVIEVCLLFNNKEKNTKIKEDENNGKNKDSDKELGKRKFFKKEDQSLNKKNKSNLLDKKEINNLNKEIRMQDIQFNWSNIINEIKKYNNSLSSVLKASVLQKISKNVLTLAFQFKFHQEKMKELKNKIIVENVIKERIGVLVTINPIFDREINNNNPKNRNKNILGAMNEVFGDDIID
ncbi:MAG: DNA polymerase III subunit gamma/tau [Xanthomonadaceae bacterium]|nr:DNA polymerase III subunit gamma/tau [Rhodospirillaceae bacterium]NIA17656.1 DNA polymerase III subunit gamma/tau [Xanthomonadaceae bacterium]